MHGSVNTDKSKVTLTSHTPIDEDGKKAPPSPGEAEKTISDILNIAPPILPKAPGLQDKEDENLFDLSTEVPPPSLEETKGETHDWASQTASLGLGGSSGNEPEEPIYATINPDTKSSKKSLGSGIDDQSPGMKRSVSERTVFDPPWIRKKVRKIFMKNQVNTAIV